MEVIRSNQRRKSVNLMISVDSQSTVMFADGDSTDSLNAMNSARSLPYALYSSLPAYDAQI